MRRSEHESVLNAEVLASLRELGGPDDPGLFVEVVDLFIAEAERQIESLHMAFGSGDLKSLERTAHTLKSSSANVGACGFATLCAEIEQLCRAAKLPEVGSLLERASCEYVEVKAALEAEKR